MCGYGGQPITPSNHMPMDLISRILDDDLVADVVEIRLNGRGESTTHPQFSKVVEVARTSHPAAILSLFTNMMFSDDNLLSIFQENSVDLYVSVDSTQKEHYERIRRGSSFDKLLRRMEYLEDATIVFTLQPDNFAQISQVCQFAASHGMKFILNVVRTDDEEFAARFQLMLQQKWDDLVNQLRCCLDMLGNRVLLPDSIWGIQLPTEYTDFVTCGSLSTCPIVEHELMIGFDGLVYPCNMFNPTVLGNVYDESLESILEGQTRQRFISTQKKHHYCKNCAFIWRAE
jgi:MoaA/NifB/PqqE/SkfB family radical SAM enzyme